MPILFSCGQSVKFHYTSSTIIVQYNRLYQLVGHSNRQSVLEIAIQTVIIHQHLHNVETRNYTTKDFQRRSSNMFILLVAVYSLIKFVVETTMRRQLKTTVRKLFEAINDNDAEFVTKTLESYNHIDLLSIYSLKHGPEGETILHCAIVSGRPNISEALLKRLSMEHDKQILAIENNSGINVAALACRSRTVNVLKHLSERLQPDFLHNLLSQTDTEGQTPFFQAAISGQDEAIKFLLDMLPQSAIYDMIVKKDRYSRSSLHVIAASNSGLFTQLSELLSDIQFFSEMRLKSSSPEWDNRCGTCLHWAASGGQMTSIQYILDRYKGANKIKEFKTLVNLKNDHGVTLGGYNDQMSIQVVDLLRPYSHDYLVSSHQDKQMVKVCLMVWNTYCTASTPCLSPREINDRMDRLTEAWQQVGTNCKQMTDWTGQDLLNMIRNAVSSTNGATCALIVTIFCRGKDGVLLDVDGKRLEFEAVIRAMEELGRDWPKLLIIETIPPAVTKTVIYDCDPSLRTSEFALITYTPEVNSSKSLITSLTERLSLVGKSEDLVTVVTDAFKLMDQRQIAAYDTERPLIEATMSRNFILYRKPTETLDVTHMSRGEVIHCGNGYRLAGLGFYPVLPEASMRAVCEKDDMLYCLLNSLGVSSARQVYQINCITRAVKLTPLNLSLFICHLTATKDYLVIPDWTTNTVSFYDRHDFRFLYAIKSIRGPTYVAESADQSLLVIDDVGTIYRVDIRGETGSSRLFSMTHPKMIAEGIAIEKRTGNIYILASISPVSRYMLSRVYILIISASGEHKSSLILRECGRARGISIHDRQLAVASEGGGLHLYSILERNGSEVPLLEHLGNRYG